MANGTIVEIITCGMATDHSLPYMVFFVSFLSYYGVGSNAPSNPYLCNFDATEVKYVKF